MDTQGQPWTKDEMFPTDQIYRENTGSMGCIFMYWGCGTKVRAAWKFNRTLGPYKKGYRHDGRKNKPVIYEGVEGMMHQISHEEGNDHIARDQ